MSGTAHGISRALTPAQILARLRLIDGAGSGLVPDMVVTPRRGTTFGGFPKRTSAIAQPNPDPAATFARFTLGA